MTRMDTNPQQYPTGSARPWSGIRDSHTLLKTVANFSQTRRTWRKTLFHFHPPSPYTRSTETQTKHVFGCCSLLLTGSYKGFFHVYHIRVGGIWVFLCLVMDTNLFSAVKSLGFLMGDMVAQTYQAALCFSLLLLKRRWRRKCACVLFWGFRFEGLLTLRMAMKQIFRPISWESQASKKRIVGALHPVGKKNNVI